MSEIKMCSDKKMAIDILNFIKNNYEKYSDKAGIKKYADALQMGIDALNMQSSWISIAERLPYKQDYLEFYGDNSTYCYYKRLEIAYQTDTVMYDIGYYDGYKWFNERGRKIENVVAWKPFVKYNSK